MTNGNRKFAERLRARIAADPDLTEAGLSVKAGLSNSTIRQLLTGKIESPTLRTATKICDALGVTVEEFMKDGLNEYEQEILFLISQMPEHLRLQFLGYGQALAGVSDQSPPTPDAIEKSTKDHSS